MMDCSDTARIPHAYSHNCHGIVLMSCPRFFQVCAAVPLEVLGIAFLLSGMATCGCSSGTTTAAPGDQSKKGDRPPAIVHVALAESRSVSPRVRVVGSIVARRTSIVASGADGIVEEFTAERGQLVKDGDVLSTLRMVTTDLGIKQAKAELEERRHELAELENGSRPEEVAEARAKMLAAKAIMLSAANQFERVKGLFESNAANANDLEQAEERAEAANQTFVAAESRMKLVEAGPRIERIEVVRARFDAQKQQVAYLEAEREKRTTKAPFTGYIVDEHTYVGQWLSKGDPIITLAKLDEVDVVVNVDQRDLSHVRLGDSAEVVIPGTGQTTRIGKITSIVPRSEWESGSRGFPVEIRLKNEFIDVDGRPQPVLNEGMISEVEFRGLPSQGIFVPKDALVRGTRGTIVFIYQPSDENVNSGTVTQVPVETGISDKEFIQVTGEGLSDSVQVVVEGAERLRHLQTVQLVAEAARSAPKESPTP